MMTSHSSIGQIDTTSRLLVGIALFASALIEYKYSWSHLERFTILLARISGPWVIKHPWCALIIATLNTGRILKEKTVTYKLFSVI